MISGIVEGINLSDENDAVNTIWVAVNKRGRQLIKASPLNMNHRIIPILGEMVYLVKASDETSTGVSNSEKYYYVSPVGVQRNINHNALPPYTELTGGGGGGFGFAAAGVASSAGGSDSGDLGTGFVEMTKLPQLQGYLGDTILEGRYGQSIRFGYTPQGVTSGTDKISAVKVEPTWTSSTPESPITIITNGRGEDSLGYNKLTVEDINKDASSIWLTDKQTISITLAAKTPVGITPTSTYKSPQVILNSDRLILNAKKDNVIITSKKDISFSTATNKTTIDLLVSAIEALAQGTFPTAVGPTGPHPQVAQIIAKIKNGVG